MHTIMTVASILLSFITPEIDKYFLYRDDTQNWRIYSGVADGARTVLSVIAASMISVAGVVFSITIVVLSLASSQFGPRLIRNFQSVPAVSIHLLETITTTAAQTRQ